MMSASEANEPSQTPPTETTTQPCHGEEKPKSSKAKKQSFPDWQPLGTVRDSFFEQMKQDNRY